MALRKIDWERQIGRRLRLRDLHIFSTVVQRGSMAQAAAHLGVSQPSVSAVIADLEHTLGVRLFDRRSRGIEPTLYGHALFKRSLAALDELKQGIREIEFLDDPTAGDVRIGCSESLAASILPPVIQTFSARYPRAVLHVSDAVSAALELPALRGRMLDVMVTRLASPVPASDDLEVHNLFDDVTVVAAGVESRWARRQKIDLAELANEQWILPPPRSWNYVTVAEAFRARGLDPPRISLVTLSLHLRVQLLVNGPFLTAFPRSALQVGSKQYSIKALPIDLPLRPWPVVALTLKHRTLSPVVQSFIEHLRAVIRSMAMDLPFEKKSA